ncbi:ribonuclease H-like protein [Pluteus cervinus]|uniref:Ribonuclease H-like protein n=1 Tax=Pluteus cervinus TaxID=181527 RepID=A0ACD3AQS9_9AGAR|nr:ribonuclease H-like protein [Pluteus cervinus]
MGRKFESSPTGKTPDLPSNPTLERSREHKEASFSCGTSRRPLARSKTEPVGLPSYTYEDYTPRARVVHTDDNEDVDDLVSSLADGPIGFDMEWRFSHPEREDPTGLMTNRAAVVQLADAEGLILVIQIYHMKRFPPSLQDIVESPHRAKLGVNILEDGKKLFEDYGIVAKNLVELGGVVAQADVVPTTGQNTSQQGYWASGSGRPQTNPIGGPFGRQIVSLAKLVARYCHKTLEKGDERQSNWERKPLTKEQEFYAACDVHSSVKIYQRLLELAEKNAVALLPPEYTSNVLPSDYFKTPSPPRTNRLNAEQSLPAQGPDQHIRAAYKYWHERHMSLEAMCKKLAVDEECLEPRTVISYVIKALQDDPSLPFDLDTLRQLVQMEIGSWDMHRNWIMQKWAEVGI